MTKTIAPKIQTLEWGRVSLDPLRILVGQGEEIFGKIDVRTQPKTIARAEIGGYSLKLIETTDSFYQIFNSVTGEHLGESRFLPWRPETYQVRLGGVRAYRLSRDSHRATFASEEGPIVEFAFEGRMAKKGSVAVTSGATDFDAVLLLTLGVLMAAQGQLSELA